VHRVGGTGVSVLDRAARQLAGHAAVISEYQQKFKEAEKEMEKHKDKLVQVIGSIEE
jgi:putative NADH-flavin reductase